MTRLYVSQQGEITCAGHAGRYLRAAISDRPAAATYSTPLGVWTAVPVGEVHAEGLDCEVCR